MALSATIETIRPCVVQICANRIVLGTGFFVSDRGHVITAKHVVDAAPGVDLTVQVAAPNGPIQVGQSTLTLRSNFLVLASQTVATDPSNDLALLQVSPNPFVDHVPFLAASEEERIEWPRAIVTLDSTRPDDGTDVAVSGYPLASNVLITNVGVVASAWASDHDAAVLLQQPQGYAPPVDRYLLDLEVNAGNSGGPAYRTDTARVIGVCVATRSATVRLGDGQGTPATISGHSLLYSSGLTVAVPAGCVLSLLAAQGVTAAA